MLFTQDGCQPCDQDAHTTSNSIYNRKTNILYKCLIRLFFLTRKTLGACLSGRRLVGYNPNALTLGARELFLEMRGRFCAHPCARNVLLLKLTDLFLVCVQQLSRSILRGWIRQKGAEWGRVGKFLVKSVGFGMLPLVACDCDPFTT